LVSEINNLNIQIQIFSNSEFGTDLSNSLVNLLIFLIKEVRKKKKHFNFRLIFECVILYSFPKNLSTTNAPIDKTPAIMMPIGAKPIVAPLDPSSTSAKIGKINIAIPASI
jgi:hypothetical protein